MVSLLGVEIDSLEFRVQVSDMRNVPQQWRIKWKRKHVSKVGAYIVCKVGSEGMETNMATTILLGIV